MRSPSQPANQEYVNSLLMLTGAEYQAISWCELLKRIVKALCAQLGASRTAAIFIAPDGSIRRFTADDLPGRGDDSRQHT